MIGIQVRHTEILDQVKQQISNFDELAKMVCRPADYDLALPLLGMLPQLYNMHMATRLEKTEVGPGWSIPVQIGERQGTRSSIYCLGVGDEVLASVLVTAEEIYFRHIKRETGCTPEAADGDLYTIRLVDRKGQERVRTSAQMEWLDRSMGMGMLRVIECSSGYSPNWMSVIWSGVAWG